MMYKFLFVILLLLSVFFTSAQSRRVNPSTPTPLTSTIGTLNELTVKEMFDEANSYAKTKFAEFESKKIPFSENLYKVTIKEQKQLAAKYAAVTVTRQNLAGEDFY